MIFIYTLFNLIVFFVSKRILKKIINPVSIYCAVWELALLIHQSGLIVFYELSAFTWIVIFGGEFLFASGCFLGTSIKAKKYVNTIDKEELRKQLKKYIVITLCLAGIAIVGNYYRYVQYYGTDLLSEITEVYYDRVNNKVSIESIPYLGSLIYVTMGLLGIYTKKYGFSLYIVPVLILAYLKSLTFGARAGIVFLFLIFVFSYLISEGSGIKREFASSKLKRYISLIAIGIVLIVMFVLLTQGRVAGVQLTYASSSFKKIFGNNAFVYKVLTYIAAPIGALNEYLKECDFDFGINTFKTIYNILAKLGLMERIDQYQSYYYTPLSCNVATWLRELIQDFSVLAIPIFLIFGFIVGFVYKKVYIYGEIRNIVVLSVLMMVVALSFFDWRIRSSDIWIALLFGYLIGKKIDKKVKR